MTTTHHAFDWHDEKSAACLSARGFDFIYAARIFLGEVIEREDTRKDYGETRIQAVGMIEGCRYMVVYTRRGDVTWIISARRMHDKEWKKWQG